MAEQITEFTVEFEGETLPVIITEVEDGEECSYYAEIPGQDKFEIFLSEDDQWVTNDEVAVEEDLIFLIGDKFEELQP